MSIVPTILNRNKYPLTWLVMEIHAYYNIYHYSQIKKLLWIKYKYDYKCHNNTGRKTLKNTSRVKCPNTLHERTYTF